MATKTKLCCPNIKTALTLAQQKIIEDDKEITALRNECDEWRRAWRTGKWRTYVEDTEKHLNIRAEREVTRLTKIIINMAEHHFE